MKRPQLFTVYTISFLAIVGCAGGTFRVGETWDPQEASLFDDGVDVVKDYNSISGKWAYRQEKELDGRMQLADFVGIINVLSVQTKSDFEVEAAKRIDIEIVETIYGEAPANKIQLVSTREAPGHQLLLRYEHRLDGNQMVFIRWFQRDDKSLGHHFHISPASEYVVSKVKAEMDKRRRLESVSR